MSFLGEIKRRKVFQVAAVYLVASWLIMQVVDVVAEPLLLPEWLPRVVIVLLAVGFPIAIIISWAFDLTSRGVERTGPVTSGEEEPAETMATTTGLAINLTVIGVLAALLMLVGLYVLSPDEPSATAGGGDSETQSPVLVDEAPDVLPNSVAVLPFNNLSPDPDNAYFAAGIHESTLNQLAKIADLNVIARTSVMQYEEDPPPIPEIAAALNVETVVEGSVRYANDRVLITAQLINGVTGANLWSEEYNRDLVDIFAVQAEIATSIAMALEAELLPSERQSIEAIPTDSLAAYSFYLRGLTSDGSVVGINRSIEDLTEAITRDPDFAIAYAQRAWMYVSALVYSQQVPVYEFEQAAVDDAEHALSLDSTLGLAHSVLASIDALNRRWADARRRVELAYELSSSDVAVLAQYVRITRDAGEYQESLRATERWVQLEPNEAAVYQQLTVGHRYARNYAAAAAAARRAIELDQTWGSFHVHLAYAQAALGNRDVAIQELQIAERIFGGQYDQIFRVGQMAMAYAQVERRDDVERMAQLLADLDKEIEVGDAVWAQVYVALGDFDEAYRRLEAAMAGPSALNNTTLSELKANSSMIPELDAPRFRQLLGGFWAVE